MHPTNYSMGRKHLIQCIYVYTPTALGFCRLRLFSRRFEKRMLIMWGEKVVRRMCRVWVSFWRDFCVWGRFKFNSAILIYVQCGTVVWVPFRSDFLHLGWMSLKMGSHATHSLNYSIYSFTTPWIFLYKKSQSLYSLKHSCIYIYRNMWLTYVYQNRINSI